MYVYVYVYPYVCRSVCRYAYVDMCPCRLGEGSGRDRIHRIELKIQQNATLGYHVLTFPGYSVLPGKPVEYRLTLLNFWATSKHSVMACYFGLLSFEGVPLVWS